MARLTGTTVRKAMGGVLAAVLVGACASDRSERSAPPPTATTRPTAASAAPAATPIPEPNPDDPLLVAAGDIACAPGLPVTATECQHGATARLVESLEPDVVAALGDLQYERGEAAAFAESYDPTWGRFKARTRPAVGNHEYAGGRASGYFGYWGDAAHGPGGWYSYDLGAWHVVVLNTVCSVVGCDEGSEQLAWLRADLAGRAPDRCTLAYFHHPRFTSGLHGPDASVQPLWSALVAAGTDVALSGHDHHYERIATADGIRQFVVGTGGRSTYPVLGRAEGREAVNTTTFGVLALTLRSDGYDWRFVPIPGSHSGFTDEGSAGCG
ncbi:MAG TPA: metallophosphoesterase [Acidimicrobiales bacterium]|nr:metallophosphoesterase [Acidimicrobiales bacterium]